MSHESCAERAPGVPLACGLASTYEELTRVDGALHIAEHKLLAAHRRHPDRKPLEAQYVYLEVLALRERARWLLGELSELWVRADRV